MNFMTMTLWICALQTLVLLPVTLTAAQPVNVALNKPVQAQFTCGAFGKEYYHNTDDISKPSYQRTVYSCEDIQLSGDSSAATYPGRLMVDGNQSTAWISTSRISIMTETTLTLEQRQRRLEAIINVDLLQEFVAERITIRLGNGLTPQKVAIYRSLNGIDYIPWVYKVVDPVYCATFFQWTLKAAPSSMADMICTTFVAEAVAPGDVIDANLTTVPAGLQEWKRARHVRLEFFDMKLTIFNFMGDRFNHYSVAELEILAECPCNGHETGCDINNATGIYECVCGGNTKGRYCEMCQDFYNQYPFQYSVPCQACFCNNHASVCYYDKAVGENKESVNAAGVRDGGGVCQDCLHNTAGVNCQQCSGFYYRPQGKRQDEEDACQACNCSSAGSTINPNSGRLDCVMNSDVIVTGMVAGDCFCKLNVQGSKCDTCKPGFYNLRQDNLLGCQACACDIGGTIGATQVCAPNVTGQCPCKLHVQGRQCDVCKDDYFRLFANNTDGCTFCDCDPGGAVSSVCDKLSGQCSCRSSNIINTSCNSVLPGFYYPDVHAINTEGESTRDVEWVNSPERSGFLGFGYAILRSQSVAVLVDFPAGTRFSGRCTVVLRYQATEQTMVNVSLQIPGQNVTSLTLPACAASWCYVSTPVTSTFTFRPGTNSLTVSVTGTLYLDRVVALPEEYRSLQSLLGDKYRAQCDVSTNNMLLGTSLEAQCLQNVFSATMFYWGGARACACHVDGSTNTTCILYGGQCTCKAGVIGRRCDRCSPGYYQLSATGCRACDCPVTDQRCDEVTGQCRCPLNTLGRQCDLCAVYHYGLDLNTGCKPCSCDATGSVSLQCDATSGACVCKSGVGGPKCDQCLDGYYALSATGCRPCACNLAGSLNNTCNTTTGQCPCKRLTTGLLCDTCTSGSFHLSPGQVDGCLQCVCMGVASQCSSAAVFLQRTAALLADESSAGLVPKIRLADSTGANATVQPTPLLVSGVVTLRADLDGLNVLYWELPALLSGDLLKVYGSVITYVTSYIVSGPGVPRDLTALLIGPNGVTYERSLGQIPLGGEATLTVPLSEPGWRLRGTQAMVSRGQFLVILASVQVIRMQATLMTGSHTVRLSRVEYSSAGTSGNRVYPVEQCACGLEYSGLSCQSCAVGFRRAGNESHEYLGTCVPCECHSHASTCDPKTGQCLECRDHTTGFSCELCQDGYYGNATIGSVSDCTLCPCFQPRVINSTCEDQGSGVIACQHCRDGYVGNLCDRCDEFHYGNPEQVVTGTCTRCDCNNNSNNCNLVSGVCSDCRGNTTGLHCERCADGFYGNASAQNCSPCNCNMGGAVSSVCDHVTGQCACQAGVGGRSCDSCLPDHWGYNDGLSNGCQPCGCVAAGSVSTQCDGTSGKCTCKTNTLGDKCDVCQPGYFGLPLSPCQPCACNVTGTLGDVTVCNNVTGQCLCKPGVMDRQCNACRPLYTNFSLDGCTACGQCQASLGNDIQSLVNVWSRDYNVTTSVSAVQQLEPRLLEIKSTLNDTMNDLGLSGNDLTSLTSTIVGLSETERLTRVNVTSLEQQVSSTQANVEVLRRQADSESYRLQALLNESESVLSQLVTSRQRFNELIVQMTLNNQTAYTMLANAVNSSLGLRFDSQLQTARLQLAAINSATYLTAMTGLIQSQTDSITRLQTLAESMESQVRERRDLVFSLADQVERLLAAGSALASTQTEALEIKNRSLTEETAIRQELTRAQGVINNATATWQEALQLVQQEGRLIRGSVVLGDVPANLLPLPPEANNWETGSASLRALLDVAESAARSLAPRVISAETSAQSLIVTAQLLNQTFRAVQLRGQQAVKAIESFEVAMETLNSSLAVAQAAAATMQRVRNDLAAVSAANLQQQTMALKNDSERIRADINSRNYEPEVLQLAVGTATAGFQLALVDWSRVQGQIAELEISAAQLTNTSADNTVAQLMTQARTRATEAQAAVDTVASYVTSQEATLAVREAEARNQSDKVTQANALISDVEFGLDTYENSRRTLAQQLRDATNLATRTDTVSRAIEDTMSSIERKLQQAQELLNKITLPVSFDGTTGLVLDNPVANENEIYNDVTLTFRRNPGVRDALLFLAEHTLTGGELEVRMEGGLVVFEFNTNLDLVKVTSPAVICDGCWARVLASRYENTGYLTVTLLATGGSVTRSQSGLTSGSMVMLNSPFYIGALPANYTTQKTTAPAMKGCMTDVRYNDVDLGIWKKATATLTQVSCCRAPSSQAGQPTVPGASFYGFGHLVLRIGAQLTDLSQFSNFRFQFRTFQRDASLLSVQNPSNSAVFSISLEAGYVLFRFGSGGVLNSVQSLRQYGDSRWCQVTAGHNSTTMTLEVRYSDIGNDTVDSVSRSIAPVDLSALTSADLVLGTASHPNSSIAVMDAKPFAGCMRNLQFTPLAGQTAISVDLANSIISSSDVSSAGCWQSVVDGVSFLNTSAYARVAIGNAILQLTSVQFDLLTSRPQGILLYVASPTSQLREVYLGLFHGNLVLYVRQTTATTVTTQSLYLSDGQQHTIRVDFSQYRPTLVVDGSTFEDKNSQAVLQTPYMAFLTSAVLHLGGMPDDQPIRTEYPAKRSLIGGIRNLFINGLDSSHKVNLLARDVITAHRDVSLAGIAPPSDITPLPPYSTVVPPTTPPPPVCATVAVPGRLTTDQGVHMNGTTSIQWNMITVVDEPIASLLDGSFVLSMIFQAYKADGILAYAPDAFATPSQYLAVYLLNGYIHLDLKTSSGLVQAIRSTQQYNDARIHQVDIMRINDFAAIIVTDTKDYVNTNKNSSLASTLRVYERNEMFVGGLRSNVNTATTPFPDALKSQAGKLSFAGALYKVTLGDDQSRISVPWTELDRVIYPAIYSRVRYGVRLSGTNSYLRIPPSALSTSNMQTFEIKVAMVMTSDKANLLTLYESLAGGTSQYIIVDYSLGQLSVQISAPSGQGQAFIFQLPHSVALCDGQPHVLTLEVTRSEVMLQYDGTLMDDKPFPAFFMPPEFSPATQIFVGGIGDPTLTFLEPVVTQPMRGCVQWLTFDAHTALSTPAIKLDPTQYASGSAGIEYGCPY